jgi:hypothetical protein
MQTIIERTESGQFVEKPRPEWASDPKLVLTKEKAEAFNKVQLGTHPRMKFVGECSEVDVVLPGEKDVIFHFFLNKPMNDFDLFLAEVVESHFGSTDNFAVAYTPEVQSWGLKATGLRTLPLYSTKVHIEKFLTLVDETMQILRSTAATSAKQSRKV